MARIADSGRTAQVSQGVYRRPGVLPRSHFTDPRPLGETDRFRPAPRQSPRAGAQWGVVRRVSGCLSTLRLAPAWPGPRGRKFSPAPAPSCPPSCSVLHNSPLTLHARRHWEHLIPTSHSQMFILLLRTLKLASGLGGSLQLCSTALDPRFSRALRPCRALATRLPASATAPPRGLSLLFATSTAKESSCWMQNTSRTYKVLVHT